MLDRGAKEKNQTMRRKILRIVCIENRIGIVKTRTD